MKKLKIVTGKDEPILRTVCDPVVHFDGDLVRKVEQMKQAMKKARGIGIAAPQVGLNMRVFLAVLDEGKSTQVTIPMVNPEIVSKSMETAVAEEGCLSLPGMWGKVERAVKVTVKFFTLDGSEQQMDLEHLNARVVLHELDHLNGVLFIDKLAE